MCVILISGLVLLCPRATDVQCRCNGNYSFRMRESVDQDGPSLFGGLRLSTQAKRMEMRPRSASKEKEVKS